MKKVTKYLGITAVVVIAISLIVLLDMHVSQFERQYAKKSVNILMQKAYATFRIPQHGVIHIGARFAEELPIYTHYNVKDILWIEADPVAEKKLLEKTATHPGSMVAMFAATDQNGVIDLHVTNNGDSSSILKLKNHLFMTQNVVESGVVSVPQRRLDDYLNENQNLKDNKYNTLVMDIQGAELVALKGAIQTLQHIDAIISEINYDELYEGAASVTDLDAFLLKHGFLRVDTISANRFYGDALYVKSEFYMHKK